MITHNLDQPAGVTWISHEQTPFFGMTHADNKKQFENLSHAAVFVKEQLPSGVVAWVTAGKHLVTPEEISTIYSALPRSL